MENCPQTMSAEKWTLNGLQLVPPAARAAHAASVTNGTRAAHAASATHAKGGTCYETGGMGGTSADFWCPGGMSQILDYSLLFQADAWKLSQNVEADICFPF